MGQRLVQNFSELSLQGDVVSALDEVGVVKPTVIQMLAIPKILRGKNVICASETGIPMVLTKREFIFHII